MSLAFQAKLQNFELKKKLELPGWLSILNLNMVDLDPCFSPNSSALVRSWIRAVQMGVTDHSSAQDGNEVIHVWKLMSVVGCKNRSLCHLLYESSAGNIRAVSSHIFASPLALIDGVSLIIQTIEFGNFGSLACLETFVLRKYCTPEGTLFMQ